MARGDWRATVCGTAESDTTEGLSTDKHNMNHEGQGQCYRLHTHYFTNSYDDPIVTSSFISQVLFYFWWWGRGVSAPLGMQDPSS